MKTKASVMILLFMMIINGVKSQSWQWVKCIGSTYDEEQVNDMKVDAQGNAYVKVYPKALKYFVTRS